MYIYIHSHTHIYNEHLFNCLFWGYFDELCFRSYTIDYFAALYCIILKKSTKDDNEEDKDEYLYNDSIFDNYEYGIINFV